MENHIDHPLTVTVEEAAKLLGIGRSTAYELVHTGDIPSLRLGRRLVVPVAHLAESLSLDREAIWATLTGAEREPNCPPAAPRSDSRRGRRSRSRTPVAPTLF